ncbi:unnamed protein product [Alternaria alternata]
MPKTSKQPRQVPLKTGPFAPILPRPQGQATIPQTQKMPPETIAERIPQAVAPGSIVHVPCSMANGHVLMMTARAVGSGFFVILPHDMGLGHHAGFAHDTQQNMVVMKPSGYAPTPEESGRIGNDNSTASLPNQSSPAWGVSNPSVPTRNMNTSSERAIPIAPDTSPRRPFGRSMIAVDLGPYSPTEPFCAILDGTAKYSCMTAMGVIRLTEIHPNLRILQTTPPQRQGQGYPTPAGIILNPQRFVELTMKALNPAIPPMSVDMLIWEGDSPVADVEVYLGWQLFEKLQTRKTQLKAGDVRGQTTDFGMMNRPMGQNANAGMSGTGNLPTVLQSDMSLAGTNNPPGPATASYGGNCFTSNTSRVCLPLSIVDCGQFLDSSDLGSTLSPMTSLFSEAPCSVTTGSSLDPTVAPVDTMAGLRKDLTNDAFAGYDWAESNSCDNGPAYETIDPAMLNLELELMHT